MEDETEKANEEADKRLKNREDLIKLRLRSSLLKSANDLGDAPGAIRDADDANVASMDFM